MEYLARLDQLVLAYNTTAAFLGLALTIATSAFLYWRRKKADATRADKFSTILIIGACVLSTLVANTYVKYIGISIFGFEIGKILPATCEASILIEGEDGLPCSLKRVLAWWTKAASGDCSWQLDELEHDFNTWMFFVG